MKQSVYIFGLLCIVLMPSFVFAEESGIIGSNMGLDFYSRIDDAGNTLAQGITKRRLNEKKNYKAFGCNAPWLNNETIDQNMLEELQVGNSATLQSIASSKKVTLTSPELSIISQCLVEKYNEVQKSAHRDQNSLETVGNIGLYNDGDIQNSDYDIAYDITRINSIIFKDKMEYAGSKNASAKAISNMLAGKPIASLFPTSGSNTASSNIIGSLFGNGTTTNTATPTEVTQSGGSSSWAGICSISGATNTESLFGEDFFDDIDSVLAGGGGGEGVAYTPAGSQGSDPVATSNGPNFGTSQKGDFFNKLPCQGIFCITINMKTGNPTGPGSAKNSIEGLLEDHTKMMEPISWSDLSQQKMTNNFYQLPFLNIKFKNKIAGARVFIMDAPQVKKTIAKEDTQEAKDAAFDLALKCAMNEAGLPGDLNIVNGFIGAGYVQNRAANIGNATNIITPVGPQEMESLAGCYRIRTAQGKKENDKGLATDLNEIQAFSDAMDTIILQILDSDKKLDKLPSK